MRHILSLMAAASVVACHSRNEEQAGAAPKEDSSFVTHVIDSARTGPPGEAGRPGNATVTPDSVIGDSAQVKRDTVLSDTVQTPTSTPQDTLGPGDTGVPPDTTSGR